MSIRNPTWHDCKIMTYNLCHVPKGVSFKVKQEFSITARIERIVNIIRHEKPDIIGFQEAKDEVSKKRRVSIISLLIKHLSPLRYHLVVASGNPSKETFYNVMAYHVKLTLVALDRFWPSKRQNNQCHDVWGAGHPRVVLEATFKLQKECDKKRIQISTPEPLEVFQREVESKQEIIEVGYCSQKQIGLLWAEGIKKGYRFIHFPSSAFSNFRVVGYKASRWFPHVRKVCFSDKTPFEVSFYPVETTCITRISQRDGAEVSLVTELPNYEKEAYTVTIEKLSMMHAQHQLYSTPLVVFNVHNGLGKGLSHPHEKHFANQLLAERVKAYTYKCHIFAMGDFNSFAGLQDKDLAPLQKEMKNTRHLLSKEGIALSGTFVCYPYDPFYKKISKEQFGAPLDFIFYKSVQGVRLYRTHSYVITQTGYSDLDKRVVREEKDFLVYKGKSLRSKYPSDHLPVVLFSRIEL